MKKALIITGPTATGKTSLALEIAKRVNGALISADSIQVYKGCDIVSGKDIPEGAKFEKIDISQLPQQFEIGKWNIDGVPLYLADVVDPSYDFSVADFLKVKKYILKEIENEKKVPIFVGGTTLYIKSLVSPIMTAHIPPDVMLREHLTQATVEELQVILAKYDKKKLTSMNNSDINNPRRLIRAIEIAKSDEKNNIDQISIKFKIIGLRLSRKELYKRIDKRVEKRLDQGAVKEARHLLENVKKLSSNIATAKGYEELFKYLNGDIEKEEMIEKWMTSEHQLAKRQMTFFRKMNDIVWFDINSVNYPKEAVLVAKNWFSSQKSA